MRREATDSSYLLGHDEQELARLEHQAGIMAPATRTILRLAGIEPGMRVLDLGSGAGDVAFEVAELVGPSGSVVGVDQSAKALRFAEIRAGRRGLDTVSFRQDNLYTMTVEDEFDAVVGRLILLYIPDPEPVLRRFGGLVRPGGVVVMMEYEMHAGGTLPATDLGARALGWIIEAYDRAGLDSMLGARLGPILRAAGFADPTALGLQRYLEPGDPAGPRLIAETVRTLLPRIEDAGVATAEEIDVDTLEERLAEVGLDRTFKPPTLVGAWARVARD